MQEAADDLVKLYKRISLDDDLDDTLRGQLLSQLSAGAGLTAGTLRLVIGDEDRGAGVTQTSPLGASSLQVTLTHNTKTYQLTRTFRHDSTLILLLLQSNSQLPPPSNACFFLLTANIFLFQTKHSN